MQNRAARTNIAFPLLCLLASVSCSRSTKRDSEAELAAYRRDVQNVFLLVANARLESQNQPLEQALEKLLKDKGKDSFLAGNDKTFIFVNTNSEKWAARSGHADDIAVYAVYTSPTGETFVVSKTFDYKTSVDKKTADQHFPVDSFWTVSGK